MPQPRGIYLDYNATAPMRPEVREAMLEVMGGALNPSSIHSSGRYARKLVESARGEVLKAVNAENLIFCGSATEANNLAILQASAKEKAGVGGSVIVSAIEHDSVFKHPDKSHEIYVDSNGVINLAHLREILSSQSGEVNRRNLVSIMLANNETGVIQLVVQAAEITHEFGGILHVDAVQALGKIDIDFKALGADLMTISSHKIGGPVGVAALVYRAGIEIEPMMFGGGQEKNRRPGTENVFAIVGFGAMAKLINEDVSRETSSAKLLVDDNGNGNAANQSHHGFGSKSAINNVQRYLESKIKEMAPDAIIYGEAVSRLPNTSCIAMPGMENATQLIHFDTNGICVSSGSACSSGKVENSRVLKAMNVPLSANALRVSTGWATTKEEIDIFLNVWNQLYKRGQISPN